MMIICKECGVRVDVVMNVDGDEYCQRCVDRNIFKWKEAERKLNDGDFEFPEVE